MSEREAFVFSEKRKRDEIYLRDIVFFESKGHYILVHTKDGETYRTRSTMEKLIERIDGRAFKRTHRAFIVNLQFAEKIEGNKVKLDSVWDAVPLSRTYKISIANAMVETI